MNAMGPMQSKRDVLGGGGGAGGPIAFLLRWGGGGWGGDPLHSYFDEPQKNEIYYLN